MHIQQLLLPGLVGSASATNLYVSSYNGFVTSLSLSQSQAGSYALATTSTIQGCGTSPSWLTLDKPSSLLYCSDENLSGARSVLATYQTSASGKLTQLQSAPSITGPVYSVIYNNRTAITQAHYLGNSISSYTLHNGIPQSLQNFTFKLTAPGTNPSRQDSPHPHEVLLDPTESFIVSPDLGADLLRVFSINKQTGALTAGTPYKTIPGSGPRHGAFLVSGNKTYFYLISELANTVTTFSVQYGNGSLGFTQLAVTSVYGNETIPAGAAAAEILLSPDHKFLLTSVRGDNRYQINNFNPANSTKITSDSLQVWSINAATGALSAPSFAPAGGSFPRQFSINKAGSLLGVGLQNDGNVVVIERDIVSGAIGNVAAGVKVGGGITAVVWDE